MYNILTLAFKMTIICHVLLESANNFGVLYFCLGKAPEPVGRQNLEGKEQDLAISNSVGLHKSKSSFELLDDCFLASLFQIHRDVIIV